MLTGHFRAIAHRGGGGEAPENSLTAFTRAVRLGFTELETDIRPTSDGVAVVHHDATLDRTTDAHGLIRRLPWSVVRQARIHGRDRVLRLEEVLEAFPDVRFTLDVKESGSVPALVAAITRMRATERVIVGSFSHSRLSRVRQAVTVQTSASPREVLALLRASRRRHQVRIPARYVQIPPRFGAVRLTDQRFVATVHSLGLEVHVWTIDDPAIMHELLSLGVDGVMTDRPSVLRDVAQSRGVWPQPEPPAAHH